MQFWELSKLLVHINHELYWGHEISSTNSSRDWTNDKLSVFQKKRPKKFTKLVTARVILLSQGLFKTYFSVGKMTKRNNKLSCTWLQMIFFFWKDHVLLRHHLGQTKQIVVGHHQIKVENNIIIIIIIIIIIYSFLVCIFTWLWSDVHS